MAEQDDPDDAWLLAEAARPSAPRAGVARRLLESSAALRDGLAAYETREGQLAMMDAVERALAEDRHLFVEAGTGTGKTLAYLVPALLSGKKVVISTATIALQEQIFSKDLPLARAIVEEHGVPLRAALMKGLANYVCKRRLGEALGASSAPALLRLAEWERTTETGDRAELGFLAEGDPTWSLVSSSTETRIGAECMHFDTCHVTAMRREAERANLVVVSHHLFLADLALRAGPRGEYASAIPPYDAVVFDEAHQLEAIATEFFGVRVTSARVDSLLRDAEGALLSKGALEAHRLIDQGRLAARGFFARLALAAGGAFERRHFAPGDVDPELLATVQRLDLALAGVTAMAELGERDETHELVARRTEELRGDLREVLLGDRGARLADPSARGDGVPSAHVGRVAWVEAKERSVAVGASPIDMGSILRRALFDRVPSVVCTSATLATAHPDGALGFEFARARLGAPPDAEGLVVESPFDYATNAAFYVPRELPEPNAQGYEARATQVVLELLDITGGGAFVLCTSNRMMRTLAASLRSRTRLHVLLQGEAPKKLLLGRFRAAGDAVLVATASFWEGVDVPGDALRLVVLDKIPFAVPSDPVVVARSKQIEEAGGNPFVEYAIPHAAISLKQGFGRLIRTYTDRGIVALLDPRARTKGYGRRLLAGLPPAVRCDTLDDVRAFWTQDVRAR
ncbi:MAG TPA: ATP-dependent DNA helicase [Polyangiaceae bacterium]|nr:ATP-dependent DNA helicase [Polyangiaceae bacterium]